VSPTAFENTCKCYRGLKSLLQCP